MDMGGGGVPKNPPQNMYPGAFPIAGRMVSERERLVGMTDAERAWRAQWLKDQHLAPNEPRFVPELQKEGVNVIRRMYRWPLDTIFKALMPVLGQQKAQSLRYYSGKALIGYFGACSIYYYFKYGGGDWTRKGGFRVSYSPPAVLIGEPGYETREIRTNPSDYNNRKFNSSPI